MLERIKHFLEALVQRIEKFGNQIDKVVSGLLEFMERAYKWIVDFTIRVKDYLIRFIKASWKLIFASLKLSLFYVPSSILWIIFLVYRNYVCLIFAIVWFLAITFIGLTYSKKS